MTPLNIRLSVIRFCVSSIPFVTKTTLREKMRFLKPGKKVVNILNAMLKPISAHKVAILRAIDRAGIRGEACVDIRYREHSRVSHHGDIGFYSGFLSKT